MEEEELIEKLEEYRDENSAYKLIDLLKEKLIEEFESIEVNTDSQKHSFNLLIRDLEEELHYIESEKLSEFDPEQQ